MPGRDPRALRALPSHAEAHADLRAATVPLSVECEVVQRGAPWIKAWETLGTPHLLVIGAYRMSVTIKKQGDASHVTIAIDYDLPAKPPLRWLARLLGPAYARWCVRQMILDLAREFSPRGMHQERSSR